LQGCGWGGPGGEDTAAGKPHLNQHQPARSRHCLPLSEGVGVRVCVCVLSGLTVSCLQFFAGRLAVTHTLPTRVVDACSGVGQAPHPINSLVSHPRPPWRPLTVTTTPHHSSHTAAHQPVDAPQSTRRVEQPTHRQRTQRRKGQRRRGRWWCCTAGSTLLVSPMMEQGCLVLEKSRHEIVSLVVLVPVVHRAARLHSHGIVREGQGHGGPSPFTLSQRFHQHGCGGLEKLWVWEPHAAVGCQEGDDQGEGERRGGGGGIGQGG